MQEVGEGDLCIIDVESSDIARLYDKILQVQFTDGDSEMFEMVSEPPIKEAVERFWTNSDQDSKIYAVALNGEHISFMCSDVLEFFETTTTTPEYHLLYPVHVRMFELDGQVFYEINEQEILARIAI